MKIEMKGSLSRDWPKVIIFVGLTWISILTALNIYHTFYSWFPLPDQTEQKELWTREEVMELMRDYSSESSDRVAMQIFPLLVIFVGIVAAFYNEPDKNKPDERVHD